MIELNQKEIFNLKFKPTKETGVVLLAFVAVLALNFIAWNINTDSFLWKIIFYHIFMALGVCIIFPMLFIIHSGGKLSDIGISLKNWKTAVAIGLIFVVFSVPWQAIKITTLPELNTLLYLMMALAFSTLFEEIFFRGFLQTRFENVFGIIPAIVLSGIFFSLYHLGYGEHYWSVPILITLMLVGMFFAIAFRTTKNVITSYILNYPHAVVVFILNERYFDANAGIFTFLMFIFALISIYFISKNQKTIIKKR